MGTSFFGRQLQRVSIVQNPVRPTPLGRMAPHAEIRADEEPGAPAVTAMPSPMFSADVHFGKLDVTKKIFPVGTTGIIDAPAADIWARVREFCKVESWWLGYYAGEVTVESGSVDVPEVGQVRSSTTIQGTNYKEKLLELNEEEYRMVYSLEYMDRGIMTGAVTTIDLDVDSTNPKKTLVTWTSAFTLHDKYNSVSGRILERQKKAYDLGIRSLQQQFSSPVPSLTASVTQGTIVGGNCDYVLLSVGSSAAERVPLSHSGAPQGFKEMKFPIIDTNDSLTLRVMDDRFIRQDLQLAGGSVEVKDLIGKSNHVVKIVDAGGKDIGSMTLSVALDNVKLSAEEEAQEIAGMIGKVAGAVGMELIESIKDIVRNMSDDPAAKWEYGRYPDAFGPLPTYCAILPASEAVSPARSGQVFTRFQEYVYSQIPLAKALVDPSVAAKMLQMDPYALFFRGWVTKPEKLIQDWMKDEELCAQTIRGSNPMSITVAKDTSVFPPGFESLKDDSGRSIQQLAEEKSLFYCDYQDLMVGDLDEEGGFYYHQAHFGVLDIDIGRLKYWYAPVLAMYKRKSDGKLSILGFQLTRHTSKSNVTYTPGSSPPNVYQLAKWHLTCADSQQHQFVSHLGCTHLLVEPFSVGAHNAFAGTAHPIGILLDPHFQDTIAINTLARQTLVSEIAPFTDATFSVGTLNAMKIFSRAYQRWDFIQSNFVNSLKHRGFDESCTDELPGYYYREDGFKIWNAFVKHVSSIVDSIYPGDSDVCADNVLQTWCDEMTGPADIKSFPAKFETKDALVESIVSLMFYCSAQHAAVNFSQERYVAYIPNRPISLTSPMIDPATPGDDLDATLIKKALPDFKNAEFQSLFAYLLTGPPDNPFSIYTSLEGFATQCEAFSANLSQISTEIQLRNKNLEDAGEIPYEYLDPAVMPQSINI